MAQRIRETTDHIVQEVKQVSGRWWEATQRVAVNAGARASGYRKRTQSKLDLTAVRRKVNARYSELGRVLYEARLEGVADPMGGERVVKLLSELDALKEREKTLAFELASTAGPRASEPDVSTEEELHL